MAVFIIWQKNIVFAVGIWVSFANPFVHCNCCWHRVCSTKASLAVSNCDEQTLWVIGYFAVAVPY